MSDESSGHSADHRSDFDSLRNVSVFLPFLFLFYILIPGPLTFIFEQYGIPDWVHVPLHVFFYPLRLLYENVDLVEQFYDWYFKFFRG